MNKIVKIFAVILMISTAAFSQQRGGQRGGQRPQGSNQQQGPPAAPTAKEIKTMVSSLSKEILLTKDQETEVLSLYTAHFEDMTASGRLDRDEMETLKSDFEKSVKNTLTKEQQTLYAAYLKKQGGQKQQGRKEK